MSQKSSRQKSLTQKTDRDEKTEKTDTQTVFGFGDKLPPYLIEDIQLSAHLERADKVRDLHRSKENKPLLIVWHRFERTHRTAC